MYVRLVRLAFQPGREEVAQRMGEHLVSHIGSQPGCLGVTCFGDAETSEYGLYVRWETREAADAAAPIIRPQLDTFLAGNAVRPPEIGLYEVIRSSE